MEYGREEDPVPPTVAPPLLTESQVAFGHPVAPGEQLG